MAALCGHALPLRGRPRQTGEVVRTGARAAALQKLLNSAGLQSVAPGPTVPKSGVLPDAAQTELTELYKALGGTQALPTLRPGSWDLTFANRLVVELDEELHFNRYRSKTLGVGVAACLPWHDSYVHYCDTYEQRCLDAGTWGKRWTTPSCEAMFGEPGMPGELEGAGAPRWKQRALYDAYKDLAAAHFATLRLARLSVWDTVGGVNLGDALSAGAPVDVGRLRDLVAERTTSSS